LIKVLGIVGSPRKDGNTEILIREALKSSEQEGAETELIRIIDYELSPCQGCRTCFKTKSCKFQDDIEELYRKLVKADGIIIGSPVYFYNVTSQTKIFIDRLGYLHVARGRKDLKNKVGGAIAVGTRSGLITSLSQILMFFHSTRIISAAPFVISLASSKGDAVKDKRGIEDSQILGKTVFKIAEATTTLRKTN
jgi:multimeric flavodoxin WrbA